MELHQWNHEKNRPGLTWQTMPCRHFHPPDSSDPMEPRPEVGGKILVGSVEPSCDHDFHLYPSDPEAEICPIFATKILGG